MAFYREYELRDEVLIEYFYVTPKRVEPSMVIRMNIHTRCLQVTNRSYELLCSYSIIVDEIRRLFELLEQPHWRSFVNITSTSHRDKHYELFASDKH